MRRIVEVHIACGLWEHEHPNNFNAMHNGMDYDGASNYKQDKDIFLVVDINELADDTKDEPFMFPSQVQQCFFLA